MPYAKTDLVPLEDERWEVRIAESSKDELDVFVFGSEKPFNSLLPGILTMAIALAIYFELHQKFDVLAAMAAMLTAAAVLAPCILLTQPASGLRESGLRLLALMAAGIVTFVNFAIRGGDAESSGADHLVQLRSNKYCNRPARLLAPVTGARCRLSSKRLPRIRSLPTSTRISNQCLSLNRRRISRSSIKSKISRSISNFSAFREKIIYSSQPSNL